MHHVTSILAPHVLNWHIKDYHIARLPYLMGFTIEGRPAGRGDLDLNFVREQLRQFGRCHSAILELWTPPEDTITQTTAKERQWAKQSLAFLKQWWQ